ncbi:retrotransposon hot spot (RHS) protein [Trypanosoma rangeli]|uniref:Retrotransposon hot spot (RHS) protein n=1 Tax=Trypanosoma rangeli TaxID=5698 RepID=A0A422MPZ4_TRYRA|nr:retrotransposon hot spot (RHS) protein [Trypanosoma rangeli]RNE95281.1 retrotransposon hot spot (RHS) protein [Trypanosoma rangeli]|eukprot:RNE95281.1 retrotransposon hot spot (RHS) protein [Trypanosoma rangeli]
MPAKRERVYAGNRKQRPASDVPQGGERQVMLGFDGNSQQPAPQHRRVEETLQQPNWTLASSIEDVLNVRVGQINMFLLNDFLRQYVDPNKAVGGDQNVAMEVFVRGPDRYVTEQRRREGKFSIHQSISFLKMHASSQRKVCFFSINGRNLDRRIRFPFVQKEDSMQLFSRWRRQRRRRKKYRKTKNLPDNHYRRDSTNPYLMQRGVTSWDFLRTKMNTWWCEWR